MVVPREGSDVGVVDSGLIRVAVLLCDANGNDNYRTDISGDRFFLGSRRTVAMKKGEDDARILGSTVIRLEKLRDRGKVILLLCREN